MWYSCKTELFESGLAIFMKMDLALNNRQRLIWHKSQPTNPKKRRKEERENNFSISILCPCGVMIKAMDCGIVVSEFVFQSRYYVHFRANTIAKGMNTLFPQLWVKYYHYCPSKRMALALNNLQRLICH